MSLGARASLPSILLALPVAGCWGEPVGEIAVGSWQIDEVARVARPPDVAFRAVDAGDVIEHCEFDLYFDENDNAVLDPGEEGYHREFLGASTDVRSISWEGIRISFEGRRGAVRWQARVRLASGITSRATEMIHSIPP